MGEVEDLSIKAARLWLEFVQAQAKAAASAAQKLPELVRLWAAEPDVPPAIEAKSGTGHRTEQPAEVEPGAKSPKVEHSPQPPRAVSASKDSLPSALLVRASSRSLKPMQKSLSRRRMRR